MFRPGPPPVDRLEPLARPPERRRGLRLADAGGPRHRAPVTFPRSPCKHFRGPRAAACPPSSSPPLPVGRRGRESLGRANRAARRFAPRRRALFLLIGDSGYPSGRGGAAPCPPNAPAGLVSAESADPNSAPARP